MKKLISLLTMATLAGSLAMAQGPGPGQGGPGGGQGGRGGFGQGGMRGGGARFVLRADVAKELNLTDAQKKTLEEKLPQMGRGGRGQGGPPPAGGGDQGGGGNQGGRPDPDQMRKQQLEAEKTIKETLSETQYKRYKELQLQQQGANALMNPDVQKELGITEAQKAQIQKVQQTAGDVMRDKMQEMRDGGGGDRETMMAEMQKMREGVNKQILDVLTAEQKAKFETMKGKPFKFENQGRGGGF